MSSPKDQKTDDRRITSTTFQSLPQSVLRHVTSFLPIEGVEAFSQVSRATHVATEPARKQIATLGLTGKVTAGDQHLYTRDAGNADTRFYFPTAPSGATEQFPHVTRRADVSLTPHLTDMASAQHAAMPNGLPPGDYPTRHRYDVQASGTLSPAILPTTNEARKTGTMAQVDPSSGLSPMHYVAPRYKAKVDGKEAVPGPGTPLQLTNAQTTPGGNPQHWSGKPVQFFNK